MRVAGSRSALLSLAFALAVPAAGQTASAPAAAPRPYEDVLRLHAAGLSDDFIVRKIARDGAAYALTTDDIIACKKAGLPEVVIEAMLGTAAKAARPSAAPPAPALQAAPEPVAAPARDAAPTPTPTPTPAPATVAVRVPPPGPGPVSFPERTFDGLVLRAPGVVLFRPPWRPGTLAFRGGTVSWTDASDPARSTVLEASELTGQFLLCPKETDYEGACWEWGVRTASGEYRFRDEAWERASSAKPAEIQALVKGAMPGLPEARYRASRKR